MQEQDDLHWRDFAECSDVDDEQRSWFFGSEDEPGQSLILHRQAQMQFCFNCPVQISCLKEGVRIDAPDGVWGGLTYSQRKRIVRPLIHRMGFTEVTLAVAVDRVRAHLKLDPVPTA